MREREKEREGVGIFHPLFHFPGDYNSQGWTQLKSEAGVPFWSPHWVARAQALGPSLDTFPGALPGS